MTDLLDFATILEALQILYLSIGVGVAASCIGMALSWAVLSVIKLLHKLF